MDKSAHDFILEEVDNLLGLNYHDLVLGPKNLSQPGYERYELLKASLVMPIRLSLFIYGYKDSENIADDFSIDNETLVDYIKNSKFNYIAERLLIQLAYYTCSKYPVLYRLYLSYLDIITFPDNRSIGTLVPNLRESKIIDDLRTIKDLAFDGSYEKLTVFNLNLAQRIAQEFVAEIGGMIKE